MPKVKCPHCHGAGTYTWTDSRYGMDRNHTSDCNLCDKTGFIKIQVPVRVYKEYNFKTWREVELSLISAKENAKFYNKRVKDLKQILEQK